MAKDRAEKQLLNRDEVDASETIGVREKPDNKSDKFTKEEATKIVEIVLADVEIGYQAQKEWTEKKKLELLHIAAANPSEIENLEKKYWMSDRNLGLLPGVLDIYQATLLATCYNPNSLHFIPVESNDVNNADNLMKFSKWGLGPSEADFQPECDDFIANKVAHGFSCFKVVWEVKYQHVDKRIPIYSKKNKRVVIGYDIETEDRRFERGVIKNIDNVDDVLIPTYGKHIQDLDFFVEVIHTTFNDLKANDRMGVYNDFDEKEMYKQFQANVSKIGERKDDMRSKKLDLAKFQEISNVRLSNTVIDLYEWYGYYEKNGIYEKWCFLVEPISETLMHAKPVRKINRSGKIPYSGGPLRRIPGMLRGGSLTLLIAPIINALNNNYNQTSDFQYMENVPFGFANLSELGKKGVYEITPGSLLDVQSSPITDYVYFPNLSRSLAWSYQDKDFLLMMLERLTGAASYFLATDSNKSTATRDVIVNEKSETKFGLWVKRIMGEISEAVNMWIQLYQENAPRDLGERVLGEDGENLFKNLSIDTLRGMYNAQMVPDVTHGSKAYEQRLAMFGFTQLQQGSIWMNPQINPKGNYKLSLDVMKKMGYANPEDYLPPMPKGQLGSSEEVKTEFYKLKQGDAFDPPEGTTPAVVEHYHGHMKQKDDQYNEIPEEYRPNFDAHLFQTYMNFMEFMQKKQQEAAVNAVAMRSVNMMKEAAQPMEEQPQGQMAQPQQPQQPMMAGNVPEGDIAI